MKRGKPGASRLGHRVWLRRLGLRSSRYTAEDVVAFLEHVLPRLDATPHVERYAIFPWLTNESSFVNEDGSMSDVARV